MAGSSIDPNDLKKKIRTQIEYYFSNENLHKDVYFRNQRDDQGWVSLEVIAQFNRVKSLLLYTNDPSHTWKRVLYDALLTSKSLEVDTESGRTRRKDSSYSLGAIWAPFSTKGDIATIKSADSQEKGKGKKSKTGKGKGSPQANAGKDADATASPEKEKKDKPVPKDGEKKKGNKNESMDQVQGELRDLRNLLNDMKGVGQPTVDEVTSAEAAKILTEVE